MRLRHWTSIVAVFCVLLHAGFLVRHNASVLQAAYLQALGLQISTWCGPVQADAGGSSPFDTPAPQQQSSKCPICMGAAPAIALLDAVAPIVGAQPVAAPEPVAVTENAPARTAVALPPSRAPPFPA